MSATLVPAIRTTYNQQDMIKGFIGGWIKQFDTIPKKESIGVLFAHNAHETGGTKSMWNNNIGNIKYIPSNNPLDDLDKEYMMLSNVWEILNGKKVIFNPPDPQTWFRSYKTLADGLSEHLFNLKNKRYKSAWVAVESGNVPEFAHILKGKWYYTGSEEDYIKNMQIWFNKYMKDSTFENTIKAIEQASIPKSTNFFDVVKSIFK